MIVGLTSDHQGVKQKKKLGEFLKKKGYEVIDFGTNDDKSVDYPDYAFSLCDAINDRKVDLGIAICYTGIGMSMACNKVENIRCAKVSNVNEARLTRLHNNANVMALSATTRFSRMKKLVSTFLETPFSKEERHQRRIDKLESHHAH